VTVTNDSETSLALKERAVTSVRRLAPVDHAERPQLHARPDAVPRLTSAYSLGETLAPEEGVTKWVPGQAVYAAPKSALRVSPGFIDTEFIRRSLGVRIVPHPICPYPG
jgi:hypothetical protein